MAPAFVVILLGADPTQALVLSQVILSFGIPFALIPLLSFAGNPQIMGEHANSVPVRVVGGAVTTVIIALNLWLLVQLLFPGAT
jgi:manganese transport protein